MVFQYSCHHRLPNHHHYFIFLCKLLGPQIRGTLLELFLCGTCLHFLLKHLLASPLVKVRIKQNRSLRTFTVHTLTHTNIQMDILFLSSKSRFKWALLSFNFPLFKNLSAETVMTLSEKLITKGDSIGNKPYGQTSPRTLAILTKLLIRFLMSLFFQLSVKKIHKEFVCRLYLSAKCMVKLNIKMY